VFEYSHIPGFKLMGKFIWIEIEAKTRAKHSVLPKASVVKGKREEGKCGDKRRKKNGSKAFGSPEDFDCYRHGGVREWEEK
jgi:hypothetical protein